MNNRAEVLVISNCVQRFSGKARGMLCKDGKQ